MNKLMNRSWSVGDISYSKFWASLEFRPSHGYCFSLGKTYGGTKAGIVICLGFAVIIAHIR